MQYLYSDENSVFAGSDYGFSLVFCVHKDSLGETEKSENVIKTNQLKNGLILARVTEQNPLERQKVH